jgi:WD40 repeat protein
MFASRNVMVCVLALAVALTSSALRLAWGRDASPGPRAKQAVDEKTTRALIAQLGDESYAKRDEAEKKLLAVGRPAVALLKKAANESADAEVRQRAASVLSTLRAQPGPGFWLPGGNVFDLAFSKNGEMLAAGCGDHVVRVFDGKTGALRHTLKAHTATVYGVVFTPDGKRLVSCAGEYNKDNKPHGEILVWDLATGKAEASFKGPPGGFTGVALAPDGRSAYAVCEDGTIRWCDLVTRKEVKAVTGHDGQRIRRVYFTPDGKLLASGGQDGTVRFWKPDTLEEVRQVLAHPNGIGTFTFSPDGKYLITGSRAGAPPQPGVIKVWDLATLAEKATIQGQTGKILSLAVSPDNKLLACGGGLRREYGEARLFDLATGVERASFSDHKEWVEAVVFSPDRNWLASGGGITPGSPGEIRVWDVKRLVARGE